MKKTFFIIVSYKDTKNVVSLLGDIKSQKIPKNIKINTIIADNAFVEKNKKIIIKKYPKTVYLEMRENPGFAKAVNKGVRLALFNKADYICIINPDTKIPADFTVKLLNSKNDITGPVISYQKNGKTIYDLGGKIDWKWGRVKHVETNNLRLITDNLQLKTNNLQHATDSTDYLSGCCLFVKAEVFEKTGLFDERYFMYFEDVDLQVRAKGLGFRVGQCRNVVIKHNLKGQEKSGFKPLYNIFYNLKSNLQFILKFQKGINLPASLLYLFALSIKILVNFIMHISITNYQFAAVFLTGIFFRTYLIDSTFIFTHEAGRDYLAAVSMLADHKLQFLGPPSSHIWLFHGPFYYYILSLIFLISGFNIYGGYFASLVFGASGLLFIYILIRKLFDKQTALLSLLLLAFLPIQIYLDRSPFHYSAVGYFSLIAVFLSYLLVNKSSVLKSILLGAMLGISVQLHLSAVLVYFFVNVILLLNKKFRNLITLNFVFLASQLPPVIFDAQNHFEMALKLVLWFPYRIYNSGLLKLILIFPLAIIAVKSVNMIKKLSLKSYLIIFEIFCVAGLWIHGQPPLHYYYFLVPLVLITFSVLIKSLYDKANISIKIILISFLFIYITYCTYYFYFVFLRERVQPASYPPTLKQQTETAKYIVRDSRNLPFKLSRIGLLDQFNGYLDNYKFLVWKFGGKIYVNADTGYVIFEDEKRFYDFVYQNFDIIINAVGIDKLLIVKLKNK